MKAYITNMIPGQCAGVSIKPPEKEVFGIAEFLCDVFQRGLVFYAQLTYSIIVHSFCRRQRCVVVLMKFSQGKNAQSYSLFERKYFFSNHSIPHIAA